MNQDEYFKPRPLAQPKILQQSASLCARIHADSPAGDAKGVLAIVVQISEESLGFPPGTVSQPPN